MKNRKESVEVLHECISLQLQKSQDYQSDTSNVTQAMHYRRGIDTIHDIILGKITRATSLLESGNNPKYDFCMDMMRNILGEVGDEQIRLDNKVIKKLSQHILVDKN